MDVERIECLSSIRIKWSLFALYVQMRTVSSQKKNKQSPLVSCQRQQASFAESFTDCRFWIYGCKLSNTDGVVLD